MSGEEPTDAVLEALWERAIERWDDDAVHAALLDHAVRAQRLPDLAGRYRAVCEDEVRGAVAKKRLDAIVVAATSMLWAMKTPENPKVPLSITLTAFAICACLLSLLGWSLWGRH